MISSTHDLFVKNIGTSGVNFQISIQIAYHVFFLIFNIL